MLPRRFLLPTRWLMPPLVLALFGWLLCWFQRPVPPPGLTVSFVGDVLLARAVPATLARDSAALRRAARGWWAGSRYVVGNLECPLTDSARPVRKAFVFRGAPGWADWLRRLGLTHVGLANNHTLDQHRPGLAATARAAQAAGLEVLGYTGADSLAGCQPTVLGADSSVVVFNFVAFRQNIPGEGCLCGRDFAALTARVAAYRNLFPERAVLVYLHWGQEYAAQPTAEQRQQARALIDAGAAAVVGAHPHVGQPVEFYRGRPIFYSLGNFLFDQAGPALQADLTLAAGRVVAARVRPLALRCAVPWAASPTARATLAARLRPLDGSLHPPDTSGATWLLRPAVSPAPADTLPPIGPPRLVLAGAELTLRYLPRRREYQVLVARGGQLTARLALGFRLYRLLAGDVDGDGRPELLVGPLKRTPLDGRVRRRLFVYGLDRAGRLWPRWRGSRLSFELVDFRLEAGPRPRVLTLEREPGGSYAVGQYYWQGFGLALSSFRARRLSRAAAWRQFVAD